MANRWGKSRNSDRFYLLGLQITVDGDYSHKTKICLLAPWKESYDKPRQHIQKQRHYFADKVCLVKTMVFPVVMCGCEGWIINEAER